MSLPKGRFGVAVVGCGRVAGHHVSAIEANNELDLVALCDLDLEIAQGMSPRDSIPLYTDYREMMDQNPAIDVVALATPSGLHAHQAMAIMTRWGKSIVVEKPPALSLLSFDEMWSEAKARHLEIFPVFQYRFNSAVQRCKRAVRDRELGKLSVVSIRQRWCRAQQYYDQATWRGTYSLDGGALTNQGIHHLDLIQYLAGPVEEVSAMQGTFGSVIDVEDTMTATFRFKSGAIGSLEITTAVRPNDVESSVSLIGADGYAVIGGWATDKLIAFSPQSEDTETYSQFNADAYGYGHVNIYEGVVETLSGRGSPAVSMVEARQTLLVLHAFYVSASEGSRVKVSDERTYAPLGHVDPILWSQYGETPTGGSE